MASHIAPAHELAHPSESGSPGMFRATTVTLATLLISSSLTNH